MISVGASFFDFFKKIKFHGTKTYLILSNIYTVYGREKHMQLITKEELADLIFENKESMYRLAYMIVENDADAQDAVGDAIVKAFGNIQRLRKKTSAKSWLMQILVNSAHDIVRKRSKWKIVEKQLDDTAVTEAFESDEMLPIVMELKEEFREIIILYYYEEFSVGEISRMLKIPTGTVKSRLARGRDKLSTIL